MSVACALAATGAAPGYTLLVGPVILGAPHLVAEARYLFFQHAHLRRVALVGVLVAQTVATLAGVGIYTLGIACLAALAIAGERSWRTAALAALAIGVEVAAIVGPSWSRFALLQGHNLVALVVWMMWRRRPTKVSIAVAVMVAAGLALILAGAFDGMSLRRPASEHVFALNHLNDALAVGFGGAWRHRLLLVFCFTQAVHYAIWLRLIPEEARARPTPRSWRASWHAFKADAGPTLARLALVGVVAVPVVALITNAVRARALYVTASEFHATVEVILIVAVFAQARPRSAENSASSCAQNRSRSA